MISETRHNEAAPHQSMRHIPQQEKHTNRYRFLASRFTMHCLSVGMVLLVLFDWTFTLDILPLPISLYLRAFLLVIFAIYLFRTGLQFSKFHFSFGRILISFAMINLVYTFASHDLMGNLFYSSRIIFWLLGTVVAYRLTLSSLFSEKILHHTVIATIFLGSIFTIYFMSLPTTEAGQNASAYLLLWCLPLLLIIQKSKFRNLALTVAIFAILLTIKRGAMIALILSLVTYGSTYLKLYGNLHQIIKGARIVIILALIGIYAIATNWDAIQTRFEDTSGSGRDRMYTMLLNHWLHSEPTNIIFGFGINSVQTYTAHMYRGSSGLYAHSDWLQYMHDFGLIGIGFLVWLHIKFLIFIRTSYKKRHPYTPSLAMGYVILFLANIYSGHLMSPNAIYLGLLIAYSSANIKSLNIPSTSAFKNRKKSSFKAQSIRW